MVGAGTGWTKTAGNNPPVFLEPSPTRSFDENTLAGRNIGGPVEATGESALEYSLEGTDAASFDIVASSGQIRTTTGVTYDYEDTISNTYTVTVKATDQNANSATITVNISLTDVDEPPERPAAPVVSHRLGHEPIGELDETGLYGPTAHYQLRPAVPAGHER